MINKQELIDILTRNLDKKSLEILREKTQLNLKLSSIKSLRRKFNIKKIGGRKKLLDQILSIDTPEEKSQPKPPEEKILTYNEMMGGKKNV